MTSSVASGLSRLSFRFRGVQRRAHAVPSGSGGRGRGRGRGAATLVAMAKVDAHLHVWSPAEKAKSGEFPYFGQLIGSDSTAANEPPMPGYAELLLEEMGKAGVSKSIIIQPGNHMFDHAYVSSVLKTFPGKFVGVLLANPAPGPNAGPFELERLVVKEGYSGVRFNPYLWPDGEKMTNAIGCAMYAKAGELGVPVSHMPFKGLLLHLDEIKTLAERYPETKFIIDHFGFCKCGDIESEEWKALLSLAQFPQAYVKLSASFRVSEQPYPYQDTRPAIRNLIERFGKERLMWGTDFPWVTEQEGGYLNAWKIIETGDEAEGKSLLTQDEEAFIYGKTAISLFPKLAE